MSRNDTELKQAVIYARFSSDMQREESIDAQVRACREHCIRKGYIITGVYKDEAKSGKSIIGREGYNQMMADAMERKFDVIVFHKIDRNARNEFNYYSFKNTLSQLGITYEYAAQNIDYSPEGQMMENVLVGFAAYYSRNLAKETKKGLNENAYKALFNGGSPPLGYKIINKKYVIDEHEAEAVRMIFKLYLAGYGYAKISQKLAQAGYKTREGRNFGKNSMYDILSNEKYIGTYTFNKVTKKANGKRNTHSAPSNELIKVENAIPAIISAGDFEMVKLKREANKKRYAAYHSTELYLLSGKIFCENCGSAMVGCRNKPREIIYTYYTCSRKERVAGGERCTQKRIQRDKIEKMVLQAIESEILGSEQIPVFSKLMVECYQDITQTGKDEMRRLTEAKIMAERRMNNIYDIIEEGNSDNYDIQRLKAVKAELAEINKKIDNLQGYADCPTLSEDEIIETLKLFHRQVFINHDEEAKKILIDLFVEKVTINNLEVSVYLTSKNVGVQMVPRIHTLPYNHILIKKTLALIN